MNAQPPLSASYPDLPGKVVLITGASSGLGKCAAEHFAQAGARIFLSARREAALSSVRDKIALAGGSCEFFPCDLREKDSAQALLQACIAQFGRIDIAINNAGCAGSQFVETADYQEEDWEQTIALNLSAVWRCMKAELITMKDQGEGCIVNMASLAGIKALPGNAAYTASKFGLVGLTQAAALEYSDRNIRINALCPGLVSTEMTQTSFFERNRLKEEFIKNYPMHRAGTPEEVAAALLWLASSQSSYLTGVALPLAGGAQL